MKHLFIINPAAGKYDHTGELTGVIRERCEPAGVNYEVLVSRAPGDCTRIAQAAAHVASPAVIVVGEAAALALSAGEAPQQSDASADLHSETAPYPVGMQRSW